MDRYESAIKSLENIIEYWTYKPEEVEAATTAIECIKEHQIRDKGCTGCKHQGMWKEEFEYGYPCPCLMCYRMSVDNYEPMKSTLSKTETVKEAL